MNKQEEVIIEAKKLCEKFIDKVESGKAKSVETYNDCKKLLELIEESTYMCEVCGSMFVQCGPPSKDGTTLHICPNRCPPLKRETCHSCGAPELTKTGKIYTCSNCGGQEDRSRIE
jgi:hypothetical protein